MNKNEYQKNYQNKLYRNNEEFRLKKIQYSQQYYKQKANKRIILKAIEICNENDDLKNQLLESFEKRFIYKFVKFFNMFHY